MPKPKEVFDNPESFWDFLTSSSDSVFEGQYFDRKEACMPNPDGRVSKRGLDKFREHVKESISAFANENKEGGLLVLGIASDGTIKGINHLSEEQINSLTNFDTLLIHHGAVAKIFDCQDENDEAKKICLIYVPYEQRNFCEIPGDSHEAYRRQGSQNILIDDTHRERIKREKNIVDFENTYCCPYDPVDLDKEVLDEFRRVFLKDAGFEYSDEEMLRQAGAIIRDGSGLAFTNAGFLFFALNPQSLMSWSYIRLLRFETGIEQAERGLPTFEKKFTGSITRQIRNIRTFFRESGFFKTYQKRNPVGGFVEEPEYPHIAIDEAIVNAVAHRDYVMRFPIECEAYKDAFLSIIQEEFNNEIMMFLKNFRSII
ncbi:MAG: RNA-binding domain-containing protein [Acidobacteriota bacterium]